MTSKFEQELDTSEGTVTLPKWTSEATHYFENEYGEQWIAKCDGDNIIIAGLDIGWKEIVLNYSQVMEYLEFQEEARLATSEKKLVALLEKWKQSENPLSKWMLNQEEKYWMLAVLHSVKTRMQFHNPNPQENDI